VQLTLFASSGENGAEAAPETIEAGAGQAGVILPVVAYRVLRAMLPVAVPAAASDDA